MLLSMKKHGSILLLFVALLSNSLFGQEDVRLAVQTGHSAAVTDLSFNHDGTLFASASEDNNVAIWHIKSGKQYANLSGHTAAVTNIAFHPSEGFLYSVSLDSSLIIWDVGSAQMLEKISFDFPIGTMDIDTVSDRLAIAGDYLVIFDISTKVKTKFDIHSSNLFTSSSFSKSGKWLAIGGGNERYTQVINIDSKTIVGKVKGATNDIVFDEKEISIFCANQDGGITNYNLHTTLSTTFTNKSELNSFNGIRIKDRYIIGTTDNGEVMVYNRKHSSIELILKAHLESVNCIDIDRNDQYMITAGKGKRIILWNLRTLKMIRTFKSSIFRISQIGFSDNGREITIGFANGAVRKNDLFSNSAVSNRAKLSKYQISNGWEFFLTGMEKEDAGKTVFNLLLRGKAILQDGA